MKTGIFSDVHGNLEALEAVLGLLREEGATRFVCCGDIVGYGPDPNRCVEIVRGLHCTCVAGNHDFGAVGKTSLANFNSSAARAVRWTTEQLTECNRLYLENLALVEEEIIPGIQESRIPAPERGEDSRTRGFQGSSVRTLESLDPGPLDSFSSNLLVVHSSPSEPDAWEYIFTLGEAESEMAHYPGGICVVGHSHYPFAVEQMPCGPARLLKQETAEIRDGAKYFINAGSVGQPRDGNPRACGIVLDTDRGTITFHRIAYDVSAVQRKIRAAGLPAFLADRLDIGR